MNKADEFLKWCSERMGRPAQISFAREAINEQKKEINELKAMVNALLKAGNLMNIGLGYSDDTFAKAYQEQWKLTREQSPVQCLANVKADAVDEFAMHIGLTGKALSNYVNNLRKTMITTSSESSLSEVVNKINEEL